MRFTSFVLLLCAILLDLDGRRAPFQAGITVGSESGQVNASNLVSLKKDLSTEGIQQVIATYTPVSPVEFAINLRGLDSIASFAAASTTLNFSIPSLGISNTFTGSTRDDSITLLKSYLTDTSSMRKILHAMAKVSPIDPIVGNPDSLLASMVNENYLIGEHSSPCSCVPTKIRCVGASYGISWVKGFQNSIITLPLYYRNNRLLVPGSFVFSAPVTLIEVGGAYSLYGSLGGGYQCPITEMWDLTLAGRLGFGGSLDLVSASGLALVSMTSDYMLASGSGWALSLTNLVGWSSSVAVHGSGVDFNYGVQNWEFGNGLKLSLCQLFPSFFSEAEADIYFIDTAYIGDKLFIQHYDEVGIRFTIGSFGLKNSLVWGEKGYSKYRVNLDFCF